MRTATTSSFFSRVLFSDAIAFEVVNVVSEKTICVRQLHAELSNDFKPRFVVGGFGGNCENNHEQTWNFSSDPTEPVIRIRLNNAGKWKDIDGNSYRPTEKPVAFHDFNF